MLHQTNKEQYACLSSATMKKKYADIVRKLFEFSKRDLCELLMSKDKRFSEEGVKQSIERFNKDLDVCVEVFRCTLCLALELDTSSQYPHYRVLSELGARYIVDSVAFCKNWTLGQRQAVLEYCMQAILLTKESVLKEENNGQSRNLR